MGNNTKYDDLILMQYADGELDKAVSEQLEQDLVDNQELQERLLVFTTTREVMIGINAKLPKHIEDLIDQQDSISEDDKVIRFSEKSPTQNGSIGDGALVHGTNNKVVNFFRNHPIQSLAASVMFGLLIGSQGMQGLYTSPESDFLMGGITPSYNMAVNDDTSTAIRPEIQGVNLSYSAIDDINDNKLIVTRKLTSGATFEATYVDNTAKDTALTLSTEVQGVSLSYAQTEDLDSGTQKHNAMLSQFIDKLKNDSTIKEGEVKVKDGTVQLIHSFTNAKKLPCKLIEVKNQYSIICQNNDINWVILFNNNHSILDADNEEGLALKYKF